jgi:hypothetical protein
MPLTGISHMLHHAVPLAEPLAELERLIEIIHHPLRMSCGSAPQQACMLQLSLLQLVTVMTGITMAAPHKAMLGQHYTTCAKPTYDSHMLQLFATTYITISAQMPRRLCEKGG